MPFCSNCGKEIAQGLKFCPECGAPQVAPTTQAPPIQAPQPQQVPTGLVRAKRPKEVSFLIIFDTIAGISLLVIGILAYFAGNRSVSNSGGLILAIVGIMSIIIAYGSSRVESWVRFPGIAVGVVMLVFGLLLIPGGGYVFGIPMLLVGGWTVYVLTLPKVRAYLTS